jgi:penicillin-binding protein 2
VDAEVVHDCISSETRPLFNRAIQGLYPPGSVFKPLTALAALESGAMNKSSGISCSGIFMLGKHPYKCWLERGHGSVTMVDAIMMSCNVFFYNAGIRAGRDEMVTMACEFGLDEKTGIDIPGERSGVVPTAAWCAARGITRWNPGDTVVMAIGQGYVLLTPLRAAVYMAAIANGGTLYTPHVVNRIVSPLGDLVERFAPAPAGHIDVSERNLALVQEGLKKVVNSNFGTGQKARLEGVAIAGKTGTVQVGPEEMRVNHSWFVGYAPCDQPRVVIAVLLEHKESGGFFAAPAAKKVFAAHFGVEENK